MCARCSIFCADWINLCTWVGTESCSALYNPLSLFCTRASARCASAFQLPASLFTSLPATVVLWLSVIIPLGVEEWICKGWIDQCARGSYKKARKMVSSRTFLSLRRCKTASQILRNGPFTPRIPHPSTKLRVSRKGTNYGMGSSLFCSKAMPRSMWMSYPVGSCSNKLLPWRSPSPTK